MYFPMTPKEGPELSYIILYIIKSPHGIIIDQTSQIKDTILVQWFPYTSERVKSSTNNFKSDSTFELYLAETLPVTPFELHPLEECYLGKSSAHVEKIIHSIQYTHPDLMYTINHISSYDAYLLAPEFQGINNPTR